VDLPSQKEMVKTSKPQLSNVLPTYNESQNIVRMIDSIANTLSADTTAEIIVVDDSSSDGTADIASRHAARILNNNKLRVEAYSAID
jgi:dolichol-phosphate mannosyltransferase